MTLTDLAIKYSVDKYYAHSYIPFYEALFKGRTVRRLLEIGIGYQDLMKDFVPRYVHGASLRMWEEYFPEADIYACDIREDTLINEGRIHSMVCDQSKGASLAHMVAEFTHCLELGFDVVIDDGSHVTEHQVFTAQCLLPRVNPGGVYIIEDVQEPMVVWQALAPFSTRKRGHAIDVDHFDKRPDDCLVVIQV